MKNRIIYISVGAALLSSFSLLQYLSRYYVGEFYYLAVFLSLLLGLIYVSDFVRNLHISTGSTQGIIQNTLAVCLISLILSTFWCSYLALYKGFLTYHLGFLFPVAVFIAYKYFTAIPEAEYKLWQHPGHTFVSGNQVDLAIETKSVPFVIAKEPDSPVFTRLNVESPVDMPIGLVFYNLIEKYNKANAGGKIVYSDQAGMQGWLFFTKTKLLSTRRVIDPDLSLTENKIADNEVVYGIRQSAFFSEEGQKLSGA